MSETPSDAQAALSLPQGGGAIKGIGETFQANLFSGTGNHSIPVALSPGRGGFGPTLSLGYSSGNGNGVFGVGWQLSLPRITRKTEKGLPRYDDTDVFVMSGAEDLVPCLDKALDPTTGEVRWVTPEPVLVDEHQVTRYRPRIEGLFARIERWIRTGTGETHWRTITKDNVTSLFGTSPATRIADPADEQRVYEWLLAETFDAVGNHSLVEYAADDPALYGDDPELRLAEPYERNRLATNRYPRRLYYGNLPDPLVDAQQHPITYPDGSAIGPLRGGRRYAFEVVFDYGDWDAPTALPHPAPPVEPGPELFGRSMPLRADRFSTFRAGFEIRTLRRCRRVLMFHHFAELGGPTLVRSTDLTYGVDPDTQNSLLSDATVTGHDRDADGRYRSAAMPPVAFSYSTFAPAEQRYQPLTARGGDLPPRGLRAPGMAAVDLFGDGLPDVVETGPGGVRYWRNLGGGTFDRPRLLADVPAGVALDRPGVGFGDMSGNGIADLLVNTGQLAGFFETTAAGAWRRFTPYDTAPGFDPQDPNVALVDLTGDGRSDALLTRDEQFLWFPCLGREGFGPPRAVARRHDLDAFPDVFLDDPARRVRLADMTGDGLNDIVLVHNARVDYWPNLGYGRFGRRITMAQAPQFDADFEPGRLFLADLNGTGCADLVYVDARRVHFWFNQSGNAWSEQHTILGTPATTDATAVQFADVFGTGTATLVWSRDLAGTSEGNYQALDFCDGVKPYVLVGMDNNMGATTSVTYAPSTRYALEDRAAGSPWITSLPFPVQVVGSVEILDHVGQTRRVSTYRYHHGHYDGREREFCGFGRVDQFDTDFTTVAVDDDADPANVPHLPPVETRSWFHTGVYFDDAGATVSDYRDLTERFRQEYYQADTEAVPLDEHQVDRGQTPAEAYRALRGAQVRSEVYARDGGPTADHPYQVSESRHRVVELQPRRDDHHAVHHGQQFESLSYHYERNPRDPRISHELTLAVDDFGNPLETVSIGYGRRHSDTGLPTDADRAKQTRTLITSSAVRYTPAIDEPHTHRAPIPYESTTFELTGFAPAGSSRFTFDDWLADGGSRIAMTPSIAYEDEPSAGVPQKRPVEMTRTYFRKDDLTDLLPLGSVEALALPGESRRLAFTAGLVDRIYGDRVEAGMLGECGYVHGDDETSWWIPSKRVFFSPGVDDSPADELAYARGHFFTTHRIRDPFGNATVAEHDAYVLLVTETHDAVANRTLAENDYRMLRAFRLTDPNGNRTQVAFDALGMVAGSAVMGKPTQGSGDSVDDFPADLAPEALAAFLADPVANAAAVLGPATTRVVYDLRSFQRDRKPVCTAVLARETHAGDPLATGAPGVQLSFGYSDGFGREIQTKVPAEPGPVIDGGPVVNGRWVATGWTVFNNKAKPVKQFEPFFDDTHAFRPAPLVGFTAVLFYDPVERVVATLHPDHTWEKVVFDPWQQTKWDVNDTVLIADPSKDQDVGALFDAVAPASYLPTWYEARQAGGLGAAELAASAKAAAHAATPTTAFADAWGRPFLTITDSRFVRDGQPIEESQTMRATLDIEGNQREVIDAQDRIAMRYDFDMLGTRARSTSMEAGERWLLNDVLGQPAVVWRSRNQRIRTTYDAARRPLDSWLTDSGNAEQLIGRTVFGETAESPEAVNLRGRVFQTFDQAGLLTNAAYDFKGNVLSVRRQFAVEYENTIDWSSGPALQNEVFTSQTGYDALNRPVSLTTPDGSIVTSGFNHAGLLETASVHLRGRATATPFVTGAVYDAQGRRTMAAYGNGVQSRHTYDPLSSRLTRCVTIRGTDALQDLGYVYDPAGNVTHIQDDAQQTVFFRNQVVAPSADYTYDAAYRLRTAAGREHVGQTSTPETTWDDAGRTHLPHPGDGQAMRRYAEQFDYDPVGNLLRLVHAAAGGDWTRDHVYDEPSQLEPGRASNRLTSVVVGNRAPERFAYDDHGNLTAMSHLPAMDWDFRDQLRHVDLGGGGSAFYVYDASGERVRTVVLKSGGTLVEERLTLGSLEVFRSRIGETLAVERETLHVSDGRQRIAMVDTYTVGSEADVPTQLIRYQLGNHLGSATLELDDAGQVISYEEYHPYGSTSYQAGRTVAQVSLKRYRYGGQERDHETGLNHHGARYYAPWLGRWTSCDPLGVKDGLNTYLSFHANPLTYVDPDGRSNATSKVVDTVATVQAGLERIAKLGYARGVEYGLGKDPATGVLLILEGTTTELRFGELIPLGHTHTGNDGTSAASTADLNEFAGKNVKEHWIFGRDDGWARYRYDAKTRSFDVRMTRGSTSIRFTISRNPNFNPKDTSPIGRASKWISDSAAAEPTPGSTPSASGAAASSEAAAGAGAGAPTTGLPPKSRLRMAGNVTVKIVGVAGLASVAGEVIKDLHEGKPGKAAVTAGVATGLGYVVKRYPPAMILAGAAATIMAYDDQVKKEANAAGEGVDDFLGFEDHSVIGGVAASAHAVEKSMYNGMIKPIGTGIGEGAAVVYIRLTSDEYTLNPFKAAWFPW